MLEGFLLNSICCLSNNISGVQSCGIMVYYIYFLFCHFREIHQIDFEGTFQGRGIYTLYNLLGYVVNN